MSKQAKLADFLGEFARWFVSDYSHRRVIEAWERYQAAPDDPPQPPEMPECVLYLVKLAEGSIVSADRDAAKRIRDHYRQPLKLEVGKCYEDTGGNVVDIVWQDPKNPNHFIGVSRLEGVPWWYVKDGTAKSDHLRYAGSNIVREVNP